MSREFSFFTWVHGIAGLIRGNQMIEYLGGKLNPTDGFEEDLCIYVRQRPPDAFPEHSYFDVVDAHRGEIRWLKAHPEIKVIAVTKIAQDWFSKRLKRDDIIQIPQQHCNFERALRPDREVKTVGIIGGESAFECSYLEIKEKIEKIGLKLKWELPYCDKEGNYQFHKFQVLYRNRQDIVKFYEDVDIQIVFRKQCTVIDPQLRTPLKLENAGSYGIPTVAYPEESYEDEWYGCFVPAWTINELVGLSEDLSKDQKFYKSISDRACARAEDYHIEHIVNLYRKLL